MRAAQVVLTASLLGGCLYSIDRDRVRDSSGADSNDGGSPPRDAAPAPADANDSSAPTDGLLGYWSFDDDETTTVVPDRTGHGHSGALVGDIARGEGAPNHGRGISTSANAALGRGSLRIPTLDGAGFPQKEGTLSLWLRAGPILDETGSVGSSNAYLDVLVNFEGRAGSYMNLLWSSKGKLLIAGVTAPDITTVQPFVPGAVDAWNHVVLVWTGSSVRLYGGVAGGELAVDTKDYPPTFSPKDQRATFLERMLGELDEIRLYDRALSDGEVRAIP